MTQVAKIVIIDKDDYYLLMKRSAHPRFPNDPDLPGGTVEKDKIPLEAAIREVEEETDIKLDPKKVIFAWLKRKEFLEQAHNAKDTYMHMVYDVISKL